MSEFHPNRPARKRSKAKQHAQPPASTSSAGTRGASAETPVTATTNSATRRQPRRQAETAREVCELFVGAKTVQHKLGTYSAKSLDNLRRALELFAEEFGDWRLDDLHQQDLIDWIVSRTEWKSPHTTTHRMGYVVSCFRWAEDERLIARCPFKRVSKLFPPLRPRTAIEPEEYEAIMKAARMPPYRVRLPRPRSKRGKGRRVAGQRPYANRFHRPSAAAFRRALFFLWETGARTVEMASVLWHQVDFQKRVMVLPEHKTSNATGLPRIIPLSPKLVRLLRWLKYHTSPKPDDHVFLNGRGRKWKNPGFARLFRRRAELIGLRTAVSAYSVRHGFCVRALEAGIGNRQIADVMGHSNTRLVDWYGKTSRSHVTYLTNVLDAMNEPKGGEADRSTRGAT